MSITGPPDGEPSRSASRSSTCSPACSPTVGILAALRAPRRHRGGPARRGRPLLGAARRAGQPGLRPTRSPASSPAGWATAIPSIAPYELSRRRGELVVAVGNDRQFAALCEVLGEPALAAEPPSRPTRPGSRTASSSAPASRPCWRPARRPSGPSASAPPASRPASSTTSAPPSASPSRSASTPPSRSPATTAPPSTSPATRSASPPPPRPTAPRLRRPRLTDRPRPVLTKSRSRPLTANGAGRVGSANRNG